MLWRNSACILMILALIIITLTGCTATAKDATFTEKEPKMCVTEKPMASRGEDGVQDIVSLQLNGNNVSFTPKTDVSLRVFQDISDVCASYYDALKLLGQSTSNKKEGDFLLLHYKSVEECIVLVTTSDVSIVDEYESAITCEDRKYVLVDFADYLQGNTNNTNKVINAYSLIGVEDQAVILVFFKEEPSALEETMQEVLSMFKFSTKQNQQNYIEGLS